MRLAGWLVGCAGMAGCAGCVLWRQVLACAASAGFLHQTQHLPGAMYTGHCGDYMRGLAYQDTQKSNIHMLAQQNLEKLPSLQDFMRGHAKERPQKKQRCGETDEGDDTQARSEYQERDDQSTKGSSTNGDGSGDDSDGDSGSSGESGEDKLVAHTNVLCGCGRWLFPSAAGVWLLQLVVGCGGRLLLVIGGCGCLCVGACAWWLAVVVGDCGWWLSVELLSLGLSCVYVCGQVGACQPVCVMCVDQ